MFSKITRWTTIIGGFIAAAIMTAELFVDDPESFREVTLFNFILVWAAAWFLANAIRFLDSRNERLPRLLGLLSLGLTLAIFGIYSIVDLELPISSSNASEASIGAAALIIAATAILSATRVPTYQETTNWSFDPIASIRQDPLRWMTIASGTMLAIFIFASPTFIPAAIAATCAVRYADTMPQTGHIRIIALITPCCTGDTRFRQTGHIRIIALITVAILLAAPIILQWNNPLAHATLPTALLIAASISAIFRNHQTPKSP